MYTDHKWKREDRSMARNPKATLAILLVILIAAALIWNHPGASMSPMDGADNIFDAIFGFVGTLFGSIFGLIGNIIGFVFGLVGQILGLVFSIVGLVLGLVGTIIGVVFGLVGMILGLVFGALGLILSIIVPLAIIVVAVKLLGGDSMWQDKDKKHKNEKLKNEWRADEIIDI
jgi:hypothetical protein